MINDIDNTGAMSSLTTHANLDSDGQSNVTNFTGPRQSATVIDQENLIAFIEGYKITAKIGAMNGIGVITTTVDGVVDVDWFVVPGGNMHNILSGTQLLAAEIVRYLCEVRDGNATI